jgi:hypothetical protein
MFIKTLIWDLALNRQWYALVPFEDFTEISKILADYYQKEIYDFRCWEGAWILPDGLKKDNWRFLIKCFEKEQQRLNQIN